MATITAWIEKHDYRERHNEPAGADHGVHLAIQGDDREPVRVLVRYSVSVGTFAGVTRLYELDGEPEVRVITSSLTTVLDTIQRAAIAETASRRAAEDLVDWFDVELDDMVRDPWNWSNEGKVTEFPR